MCVCVCLRVYVWHCATLLRGLVRACMNQALGDRSYSQEEVCAVSNQLRLVAAGWWIRRRLAPTAPIINNNKKKAQQEGQTDRLKHAWTHTRICTHTLSSQYQRERQRRLWFYGKKQHESCLWGRVSHIIPHLCGHTTVWLTVLYGSSHDLQILGMFFFFFIPSSVVRAVLDSLSMPWNSLKYGRTLISYTMPFLSAERMTLRSDGTFTSWVSQGPGEGSPDVCLYKTL